MNTITEKITKVASKLYSQDKINHNITHGSRNGESMADISARILNLCTVDENHNLILNGHKIGWIKENGMGWIDDKAYDTILKNMPLLTIPDPADLN